MVSIRFFLASFFFLGLIACNDASKKEVANKPNVNRVHLDSLDLELINKSEKSIIPGFAVSIIKGDRIVFKKGYGYSDLKNNKPFTENTVQTIASISKTFIGLSIMKLVENGTLNLDEPINNTLPFKIINPHFPDETITIRHLVTHTSTINDEFDDGDKRHSWLIEEVADNKNEFPKYLNEDIFYYDGQEMSLTDYVKEVCTKNGKWYFKTNFAKQKPGVAYEYSNMGAAIAALIVELKSGMPFYEFTQKNIFEPLKMKNTTWFYNDLNVNYSKLYVPNDHKAPEMVYEFPRYHEAGYPDGQLKTSINDLSLYLIEMINGYKGKSILLKKASFETMFNHQLNISGFDTENDHKLNDEFGVGVFWAISSPEYRLHKGGMIGVYSLIYFNPKTEMGVIVISNMADNSFGEILQPILKYEEIIGENTSR